MKFEICFSLYDQIRKVVLMLLLFFSYSIVIFLSDFFLLFSYISICFLDIVLECVINLMTRFLHAANFVVVCKLVVLVQLTGQLNFLDFLGCFLFIYLFIDIMFYLASYVSYILFLQPCYKNCSYVVPNYFFSYLSLQIKNSNLYLVGIIKIFKQNILNNIDNIRNKFC